MKIEETFSVKQEEDDEEQAKMAFIKEERENIKIEEVFSVKQEETEEQTAMAFIKEESENLKVEETFSVKQKQTECVSVRALTSGGNNAVREEEKRTKTRRFKVKNKVIYQRQERRSSLHCCVPRCSNSSRYNGKISFHMFPIAFDVRAQWLAEIRRDFSPTRNTRVCSVHFQQEDFVLTTKGLRRLKKGTVPSRFAWTHNHSQ